MLQKSTYHLTLYCDLDPGHTDLGHIRNTLSRYDRHLCKLCYDKWGKDAVVILNHGIINFALVYLLVCFDSLRPSPQFFSHVGMALPGLNQYSAEDKGSDLGV